MFCHEISKECPFYLVPSFARSFPAVQTLLTLASLIRESTKLWFWHKMEETNLIFIFEYSNLLMRVLYLHQLCLPPPVGVVRLAQHERVEPVLRMRSKYFILEF